MLKNFIRNWCQKLLGFDRYLFLFSRFNIFRIRFTGSEKAFRYFVGMIPDNGAILDVGANIGFMTTILAKRYPASTIYAFEPVPANSKALKRIVAFYRLHNVEIMETALGDEDGTVNMIMPRSGNAKMQGLSHVIEPGTGTQKTDGIFSVPVKKMDQIAALQQLPKISAIKIDVENFEYYVLKGAQDLLRKHKPLVFCELWNNERRALCLELMQQIGYRVKVLEKGQLVNFTGQTALDYFFLP